MASTRRGVDGWRGARAADPLSFQRPLRAGSGTGPDWFCVSVYDGTVGNCWLVVLAGGEWTSKAKETKGLEGS